MPLQLDEDTPAIGTYGAQKALQREIAETNRLIRELRDSAHLTMIAVLVPYGLAAIYLIKLALNSSVLW
jgi:hypothetical protein